MTSSKNKSSARKPRGTRRVPAAQVKSSPPNASTRLGQITTLLQRTGSASPNELFTATGWQAYSIQGAIAGSLNFNHSPRHQRRRVALGGDLASWLVLGGVVALVSGYRRILAALHRRASPAEAGAPKNAIQLERNARHIVLPEMLYERAIEVAGRFGAQGDELTPLDEAQADAGLRAAFDAGIRSVAIVFMHGDRYPDHERRVAEMAREIGFTQISVSHIVSPLMKLVSRGDTTVVDAYLSPILRRYVDRIAAELADVRLMFMQSNGGLIDAFGFQGKDSILSGPAGGVVGAVQTSAMAGFDRIIGFDMGGTSTDVSHYDGEFERRFVTEIAGVRVRAPVMHIHTVAAGGGSILHFDGARYRVGPDSAGADPGPICYRRDGPPTVTDCNVMLEIGRASCRERV